MKASVVNVIRQICDAHPNLFVLDYQEAFPDLWLKALQNPDPSIAGQKVDWRNPKTTMVIVGLTPPQNLLAERNKCLEGINFSGHLTALSWAAAWRIRHRKSQAKILVVDFSGNDSLVIPSALKVLLASRNADGQSLIPQLALLSNPTLMDLLNWFSETECRTLDNSMAALIQNTIWNGLTSEPGQHHALSNVLGALLLGFSVGRRNHHNRSTVQDYLFALVHATSSKVGDSKHPSAKTGEPEPWLTAGQQNLIHSAVLIDDLADLWSNYLSPALGLIGGKKGHFITTQRMNFKEHIKKLPNRLGKCLASGRRHLEANDLIPGNHELNYDFILFLDLRLFPGAPQDGDELLKQIASVGIKLLESSRSLPWLTEEKSKEHFKRELESWAASANSPRSRKLPPPETILPRLLSLIDPTLPIIIFSSTRKNALISPFRDFGNIITSFQKPIMEEMGSDWNNQLPLLRLSFQDAIGKACRILNVRRGFIRLKLHSGGPGTSDKLDNPNQPRAIEIFIDESQLYDNEADPDRKAALPEVYAIGAVAAVADNYKKMHHFNLELEQQGVVWGLSCDNRNQLVSEERQWSFDKEKRLLFRRSWVVNTSALPRSFLRKKQHRDGKRTASAQIEALAKKHGIRLTAAVIGCKIESDTENQIGIRKLSGLSLSQTDELHHELTSRLIQLLLLYDREIKNALGSDGTSIALDVGERTAGFRDVVAYLQNCETFFQDFGLRYLDQHLKYGLTLEERRDAWDYLLLVFKRNNRLPKHWPDSVIIDAEGQIQPDEETLSRITGYRIWDRPGGRLMHSVTASDGLKFLREGLAALHHSKQPNIARSRGVCLFNFDDNRDRLKEDWMLKLDSFPCFPYQIHYLADWIATSGAVKIGRPGRNSTDAFASFFEEGFVEEWTAELRQLFLAGLRLERQDLAGGLEEILRWIHDYPNKLHHPSTVMQRILALGAEVSLNLSGTELRRLFQTAPQFAASVRAITNVTQ